MYNCVYYWAGGTLNGEWRKAQPAPKWLGGEQTLEALRRSIERMGYRCVYGHTDIGAPEGPPR